MKKILITVIVVFSTIIFGQTNGNTVFNVTAQSEVSILADLIIFQITISEENSDPEQAYLIHKEKEKKRKNLQN